MNGVEFMIYLVFWIGIGLINFIAAVRLEGLDSSQVEQNDKIFAALVVLWPLLTISMIVWAVNQMRQGEGIKVGGEP